MKAKQSLVLSILVMASAAAMADGGDIGLSNYPVASTSTVSRSAVEGSVVLARVNGELRPAGEAGDTPYAFSQPTHSDLTRDQVKQATLAAAKAGELAPAGIGYADRPNGEYAHPMTPHPTNLFATIAAKFQAN